MQKQIYNRLFFREKDGNPLTLSGRKDVEDNLRSDAWADTTTPSIRIYRGHAQEAEDHDAELHASGILKIYIQDFLR